MILSYNNVLFLLLLEKKSIVFYKNNLYSNNQYRSYMRFTSEEYDVQKKQMAIADIFDNLRRVYQVINEQSKKAKKQTGITGPQLWAIKMIAESSPVQVSELAHKMYLHPATVVGILNRLEEQGLVIRTRTREDRRIVDVNLTPEGNALVARAPEVAQGLLAAGLEVLPAARLLDIASALDQLVHILGAQEVPPHLILSPEVNLPRKLEKD
jgi:MarR family transcriptional regulator, organic hydroperoxide resistance regulator